MGTALDVVAELESRGYTGQFLVRAGGDLECLACGSTHPAEAITLDAMRRYEGSSDPADEMMVTALTCVCGAKGTLLFTYGPLAPPEEAEALNRLTDARASRRAVGRVEATEGHR